MTPKCSFSEENNYNESLKNTKTLLKIINNSKIKKKLILLRHLKAVTRFI